MRLFAGNMKAGIAICDNRVRTLFTNFPSFICITKTRHVAINRSNAFITKLKIANLTVKLLLPG